MSRPYGHTKSLPLCLVDFWSFFHIWTLYSKWTLNTLRTGTASSISFTSYGPEIPHTNAMHTVENRNCRAIQIPAHFPAQPMQVKFCGLIPAHYASLVFNLQPYSVMLYQAYSSTSLSPSFSLSISCLNAHVILNVWNILLSHSPSLTGLPLWYSSEFSLGITSSKRSSLNS